MKRLWRKKQAPGTNILSRSYDGGWCKVDEGHRNQPCETCKDVPRLKRELFRSKIYPWESDDEDNPYVYYCPRGRVSYFLSLSCLANTTMKKGLFSRLGYKPSPIPHTAMMTTDFEKSIPHWQLFVQKSRNLGANDESERGGLKRRKPRRSTSGINSKTSCGMCKNIVTFKSLSTENPFQK